MQENYRDLFFPESQEYLKLAGKCLLKLENNPADLDAINEIFRCVHTLKGMSATMGYEKLTKLSHRIEDVLDEVRSQTKKLDSGCIDVLFHCVDTLEQLLQEAASNKDSNIDIIDCINKINGFFSPRQQTLSDNKQVPQILDCDSKDFSRITELKNKDFKIFKVKITFVEDCVMKQARAYIVITNLKKIGEIIKSAPTLDDLKEGRFESSCIIIIATKEPQEGVRHELLNISEIEQVDINNFDVSESDKEKNNLRFASYVKKIQSVRIPIERLDKIMNLMGELAIARIQLAQIVQSYHLEPLERTGFMLSRLISSLQDEIMQTRLLPVAYILDSFPRIVRDLARRENKDVELSITGGDIELDRVILDEISEPLIHLVRNSIDHGIETPEQRKSLNKKPAGKIFINVTRQKGQIFIEVGDDGRGVDFSAVRLGALAKGLITQEEADGIDEKRVLDLITLPGFSTSREVTDVSGRGVGLDVVKTKIESLGGNLDFETKQGEGSRFILMLPLTLAIIKAMLVKVEEEILAIPLMNIRETIKLEEEDLKTLQNIEIFRIRDEVIPAIRLNKELGFSAAPRTEGKSRKVSLVVIEQGKKALGLVVSQVLGEQDIVVKPLGSLLKKTKGIAGATILGDGRVALILDTISLK